MKDKVKEYTGFRTLNYSGSKFTILVFAELRETAKTRGLLVQPVFLTRDNAKIVQEAGRGQLLSTQHPYQRTKSLNLGWAICTEDDLFDLETGKELCRKRFAKDPLTTSTGYFLTDDMVNAIVENEVEYIAKNFEKFYKRNNRRRSQKRIRGVVGAPKEGNVKLALSMMVAKEIDNRPKNCPLMNQQPKCEDFEKKVKEKCEENKVPPVEKNENVNKFTKPLDIKPGTIYCKMDKDLRSMRYICVESGVAVGQTTEYATFWSATEILADQTVLICYYGSDERGKDTEGGYRKATMRERIHILSLLRQEGFKWSVKENKMR